MPSLVDIDDRDKMRIITINVPESTCQFFEKIVRWGLMPSRSEVIRFCISRTLPSLLHMVHEVDRILGLDRERAFEKFREWIEEFGYKVIYNEKALHVEKGPRRRHEYRKNIWWDELKLKNGDVVRVPRDPEEVKEEIENGVF